MRVHNIRFHRGLRKEGKDEEKKDMHKKENQPEEVMHGEDNTDKTVDELQQGEEVPQVRRKASSYGASCYACSV